MKTLHDIIKRALILQISQWRLSICKIFHLADYADLDVQNKGSRTEADTKKHLYVKDVFLFSSKILLVHIHQFLNRGLAYYNDLSC